MTAQCRQCGRFVKSPDPVEAKTAQLRAEIPYLKEFDRLCVEAVEQELSAEFILDEALKVPGFAETGGLA